MPNPILRIRLIIQPCALNIYILVPFIKIHIPDGSGFIGELIRDANGFKEGWDDEVDVLAWVGEEADGGEESEGGHGAGIVISGQAGEGGIEAGGDIL